MSNFSNQTNQTAETTTTEHWSSADLGFLVLYSIVFVLGTTGNILVIHYFGFKSERKLLYHIYLIHLAVADLITSIITPTQFVYTLISNHEWHLGDAACKIIASIGPLTVNVSAWLLASIAHERLWGVSRPMEPRFSRRRIHITSLTIWLGSIVLMLPWMHSMSLRIYDTGKSCEPHWVHGAYELSWVVIILVVQSLFPTIFMTHAFRRILASLKLRPTGSTNGSLRSIDAYSLNSVSELSALNPVSKDSHPKRSLKRGRSLVILTSLPVHVSKYVRRYSTTSSNHLTVEVCKVSNKANSLSDAQTSKTTNDRTIAGRTRLGVRDTTRKSRQRSRIKMLIVTFTVFVVCSLPYNVFYVIYVLFFSVLKKPLPSNIILILNYLLSAFVVANSVTNCFIYAGMDASFRLYCKTLLCRRKEGKQRYIIRDSYTMTSMSVRRPSMSVRKPYLL